MRRGRGLRGAVAGMMLLCSVAVWAGAPVESYYGHYDPAHLSAVEKHHLPQAREKAARKDEQAAAYAWGDIEFILRRFPNHPQALLIATDLSLRLDSRKRVEKYMERAVSFDPRPAEPWIIYGIFLHRWGDYAAAVEKYREALKRDAGNPETWYNLGLAYFELKRYDEALEAAHKAYAQGYPLPGLRNRLRRAGHWRPMHPQAGG